MRFFASRGALQRLVSSALAIAMLISVVALPGGAAAAAPNEAFLPDDGGTNLSATVDGLSTDFDLLSGTQDALGADTSSSLAAVTSEFTIPELRVSSSPSPAEAGGMATITAEFRGMPSTGDEGGIDSATLVLPEGFVPMEDGAVAVVGSTEASIVVDPGARTATVDNFLATDIDRLVVTLASEMPTVPGEYVPIGTFRNVGGSTTSTVTAVGRIKVVPFGITVTASPSILGDSEYGYAMAGGDEMVTLTVRGNFPKPGVAIVASATTEGYAGSLDDTRAVTDESGTATFTVRSNAPSVNGDVTKYGRAFKQFKFADEADSGVGAFGYAHFYALEIAAVSTDKMVAFADGTDSITYTFTVRNPSTGVPASEGTRIYFAPGGWDAESTALSAYSAVTDASGQASVEVSRDEAMTQYGQLSWVVASMEASFAVGASRPAGTPGVQFMDYIASAEQTITAQQSSRGALVEADFVIRDSTGDPAEFTRLDGMIEATSTSVLKTSPFVAQIVGSAIRVSAEVKADAPSAGWAPEAGDLVQAALNGQVTAVGPFNSEKTYVFGIDMPVHIVNNAQATGIGSVYLGKANITGTNLRRGTPTIKAAQGSRTYALSQSTIAVDLDGRARPQLFDMPVTMVKGTYDLIIDGITFPGALVVGDSIAIGVNKVVIQMGVSRGLYPNYAVPGSTLTLFGVVSTTGNASVPSAIVHVYSSARSDGSNPTFVGSALTANGQFSYRVNADKTKYYFATTDANMQYMSGDSREAIGRALLVGVKTRARMKITSMPTSVRRNRVFTLKGAVPRHSSHNATYVVMAYRWSGSKWVSQGSFTTTVKAGATTFSRRMRLPTRGRWRVIITHGDWNHIPSSSPFRSIAVK